VWLKTDNGILVNAKQCPSVELWQDNAPNEVFIECFSTDSKLNFNSLAQLQGFPDFIEVRLSPS
jgi:hypothetical protein